MSTRRASVTDADTPDSPDHAPGVQLVQPAVAEATQPGLFAHLPDSALTEHHRAIADARPGDRMLLCLSLEVSASAAKVASALAFHGWTSWPSRETLGRFANLHPNHVSRACKELEDRGIISRRRRYHQGGNVGIQYTFNGDALVLAAADQNHPTLGHAIAQLAAGANTNLVSAAPEAGPDPQGANTNLVSAAPEAGPDPAGANTNLVSAAPEAGPDPAGANTNLVSAAPEAGPDPAGANTNLVSAAPEAGPDPAGANTNLVSAAPEAGPDPAGANTNLVSAAPEAGPDPQGANTNLVSAAPEAGPDPAGANTNLVSAAPEAGPDPQGANTNLVSAAPEAGPDPQGANTNLVSAAPEAGPDPQGANTNLVSAQPEPGPREYQSGISANTNLVPEPEVTEPEGVTMTDEISQSNSGSSGSIETVPIPDWYSHLSRQIDASRLPDFQDLHEAALLSGWTDRTMASAAAVYAKNYRSQRVTDPVALFRKLATQEAGRQPPAVAQRHRNYSAEYHRRRLQGG